MTSLRYIFEFNPTNYFKLEKIHQITHFQHNAKRINYTHTRESTSIPFTSTFLIKTRHCFFSQTIPYQSHNAWNKHFHMFECNRHVSEAKQKDKCATQHDNFIRLYTTRYYETNTLLWMDSICISILRSAHEQDILAKVSSSPLYRLWETFSNAGFV